MVFAWKAGPLKIATFNINNINKRLHNLTAWLARAKPDIVCLQELKVEQRAFPAGTLRDLGYRAVWLGERSWNGVAILARECDPVLTRSSLPGNSTKESITSSGFAAYTKKRLQARCFRSSEFQERPSVKAKPRQHVAAAIPITVFSLLIAFLLHSCGRPADPQWQLAANRPNHRSAR
jgi:exonuclease III